MTNTLSNKAAAGHTSGPWSARREFSSLCIVDAQGDYIADIHDRETYDENLEVEDESASEAEASANAHLIAAAPELLADLQFAVKLLRPFGGTAQIQRMEATIAKAKGTPA